LAKILVVDDSATSLSIAVRLLVEHEVAEAQSGQAALDMIARDEYDLILLDLLMPGMGGFEVLGELAARGSLVPVIVVTADIQNSTRTHAKALGAAGLVNKPLTKAALKAVIASVLDHSVPSALPTLEPLVKRAFEGLMRVAVDKAAGVLNTMLSSHIALSAPAVEMISAGDLGVRFSRDGSGKLAAIEMRCAGGFDAWVELIFTSEDAVKLADCVASAGGGEDMERDSVRSGALCEMGNIVINAVLGTISNALDIELSFTVPSYFEGGASELVGEISLARHGVILLVKTKFEVEDLSINGDIALFLNLESFESLSLMLKERAGEAR
jgi:chemotaxis protein CheC